MHSMFHALCNPSSWWNFRAVLAFCPNTCIYCFSTQIWHFVFYSFLNGWWPVMTGVLTNYSRVTYLPLYSKQNVFDSIWQDIQDVLVADIAFWTILDHISDTAFCVYFQLWPLFCLVSDRLEGQVSEQKDTGTLDKVKNVTKNICWNCRYSILYCGWWFEH